MFMCICVHVGYSFMQPERGHSGRTDAIKKGWEGIIGKCTVCDMKEVYKKKKRENSSYDEWERWVWGGVQQK